MADVTCSVSECKRKAAARGFCESHARKAWLYGDPLGGRPAYDTPEDRFWAKVDRRGSDECWPWTASTSHGYGAFGGWPSGSSIASRIAWEIANGPVPPGMHILHECDNPPCCNPAHLVAGTRKKNAADASTRGLIRRGSRHHNARLTEAQVLEIKHRWIAGERNQRALARDYGVDPILIFDLLTGKTWAWLSPDGWVPHVPSNTNHRD